LINKVAIIHDSFLHIGGAEKVLLKLVDKFPEADIYISLLDKKYTNSIVTKGIIHTSILSKLPFIERYSSLLKPLVLLYWETLNLNKYELIISSSHSFSSKSVNKSRKAKHISYIHTPPKYLYNEYNEMNWIKKFPFKQLLFPILYLIRKHDYYSAQKPDLLVANSEVVKDRIKKYYNRNSIVINPPHNTPSSKYKKLKGKYFLFFSRLEKQKGAELVIRTFTYYNLPLVVIGTGSEEKFLKSIAGKTISFRGFVSNKQKEDILSKAISLIYAAKDEDYGLVIPEVISHNVPVLAYNSGAIKEHLKKTNIINTFYEFNKESLYLAIKSIYYS